MAATSSASYQSTSSLLSPPSTYFSFTSGSSPRSGGILLNAYKSSACPLPTPPLSTSVLQHYPARPATPNSNNSSEEERGTSNVSATGTPRKIRFAPLPEPRKEASITEDGQELDMVEDDGALSFNGAKEDSPPRSIEEQLMSSRPGSIASTEDDEDNIKKKRRSSGTWTSATKSLLSPFLAKSPSKGGFLSPDTDDGEEYWSTKLQRRTSTGGLSGANPARFEREVKRKEEFLGGSSLKPTVSATSDVENASHSHKRAHSADKRRLLNGRVYGGGRHKQPKYEEPEFVEWGYGGMGSQKAAARERSKWASVQGKSVYTAEGDGEVGKGIDEEDDGSGMAWVRKRRRERELKAQQEKEQQAKNGQNGERKENVQQATLPQPIPAVGKLPASAHSSAKTTPTASTLSSAFSSRSQSPQPSVETSSVQTGPTDGASTPHGDDEHHYRAINLPPPPHHHHHHHHHKHHEKDHRPIPPPLAPVTTSDAIKQKDFLGSEPHAGEANTLQLQLTPATPVSPEQEDDKLQLQQAGGLSKPLSEDEESEMSDEESSDEDADAEDEAVDARREKKSVASGRTDTSSEADDTESDAEDAADKARLTSTSAGVEKVSTKARRG